MIGVGVEVVNDNGPDDEDKRGGDDESGRPGPPNPRVLQK